MATPVTVIAYTCWRGSDTFVPCQVTLYWMLDVLASFLTAVSLGFETTAGLNDHYTWDMSERTINMYIYIYIYIYIQRREILHFWGVFSLVFSAERLDTFSKLEPRYVNGKLYVRHCDIVAWHRFGMPPQEL